MYSQKIIERSERAIKDDLGVDLVRYADDTVDDMTAHLVSLVSQYDKEGNPTDWVRQPSKQEWDYITNERLLCKIDFQYWARRYAVIELAAIEGKPTVDTGRLGITGFMRPQEVFLEKLAKSEDQMYDKLDRGEMVDGLRYFINKGRQLHFTGICRLLSNHRVFFWPDTQAIAASVNEDMVSELFRRDKLMYDGLPWFLRPRFEFDTKNAQLTFQPLGSGTVYHQANQHGGMGMGRALPVAHMTEVAFWDEFAGVDTCKNKLDYHLRAAIPQSVQTLYVLESTSNGLGGWWYDQIKLIERGKSAFDLYFAPWFVANRKYRRTPPEGWEPSYDTKAMQERAERHSDTYLGRHIELDKFQLYWYESEKAGYEKRLSVFYSNYPSTLDEAFQNFGSTAFQPELLAEMRRGINKLVGAYDIV